MLGETGQMQKTKPLDIPHVWNLKKFHKNRRVVITRGRGAGVRGAGKGAKLPSLGQVLRGARC